jgi:hypothetical protein
MQPARDLRRPVQSLDERETAARNELKQTEREFEEAVLAFEAARSKRRQARDKVAQVLNERQYLHHCVATFLFGLAFCAFVFWGYSPRTQAIRETEANLLRCNAFHGFVQRAEYWEFWNRLDCAGRGMIYNEERQTMLSNWMEETVHKPRKRLEEVLALLYSTSLFAMDVVQPEPYILKDILPGLPEPICLPVTPLTITYAKTLAGYVKKDDDLGHVVFSSPLPVHVPLTPYDAVCLSRSLLLPPKDWYSSEVALRRNARLLERSEKLLAKQRAEAHELALFEELLAKRRAEWFKQELLVPYPWPPQDAVCLYRSLLLPLKDSRHSDIFWRRRRMILDDMSRRQLATRTWMDEQFSNIHDEITRVGNSIAQTASNLSATLQQTALLLIDGFARTTTHSISGNDYTFYEWLPPPSDIMCLSRSLLLPPQCAQQSLLPPRKPAPVHAPARWTRPISDIYGLWTTAA